MLKVGAIGGVFALRFALMRKNRANDEVASEQPEAAAPVRRHPHPVSRKKKRRRRR